MYDDAEGQEFCAPPAPPLVLPFQIPGTIILIQAFAAALIYIVNSSFYWKNSERH